MKKRFAAMALAIYLTGVSGTAYANIGGTSNTNQSEATSPTYTIQDARVVEAQDQAIVSIEVIEDSAGVLPNSLFYSIERKIEILQLAITESEEKLAALKAQYATERAAEAAIMLNEGEGELASEATDEYVKMLDSAAEHINNAIQAKNETVQTLETLNEAYKRSEQILKTILEKAPEDARVNIESALNEQDKAISVINGFHAAKEAFFAAKDQFEEAKKELKAAKRSGDAEAARVAEEKVKEAEALKDELEAIKDSADSAKEEVKSLIKIAEKRIDLGMHQIEKADEKMEKLEEKARKKARKSEEKAKKLEEKETEKTNKEEGKAREALKKAEEKAREEAKKAVEKAREEAKKAEEKAKKAEEKDRD